MNQEYEQYLQSEQWQNKRMQCLVKVGKRCEVCGSTTKLHCHHLTYANIFNENVNELMALCEPHHEKIEELYKAGKIRKDGDPDVLRALTVRLLTNRFAVAPSCEFEYMRPSDLRKWILDQPAAVSAMTLPRQAFKKAMKKEYRTHPAFHRIHANAIIIYNEKNGTKKQEQSPVSMAPFVKPPSDRERAAFFESELDRLVERHAKLGSKMIFEELMRKAAQLFPK